MADQFKSRPPCVSHIVYEVHVRTGPESECKQEKKSVSAQKTLLLIEDEEMLLDVMGALLKKLDYKVLEARTGQEAVELAETFEGAIDLAILDMQLPDMSGEAVFPLIVKSRPRVKVILTSGHNMNRPARETLDAGAKAFIQKPTSFAVLKETLNRVIQEG